MRYLAKSPLSQFITYRLVQCIMCGAKDVVPKVWHQRHGTKGTMLIVIQLYFKDHCLQYWQNVHGHSITLATIALVISLLGVKLLRNSSYSI